MNVSDIQAPRYAFYDKDQVNCLSLNADINGVQRPMYGSEDGHVYLMDQEDRDVGGVAYEGSFKVAHSDFRAMDPSIANKNKLFDFLSLEFVPEGEWTVSVDVFIDGKFSETLTFPMKVRKDGIDAFTLGQDKLGREEAQSINRQLHGTGRRISFEVKQSGLRQTFKIASMTIGFRLAGERATQLGE